jgi:hypothetical protein
MLHALAREVLHFSSNNLLSHCGLLSNYRRPAVATVGSRHAARQDAPHFAPHRRRKDRPAHRSLRGCGSLAAFRGPEGSAEHDLVRGQDPAGQEESEKETPFHLHKALWTSTEYQH